MDSDYDFADNWHQSSSRAEQKSNARLVNESINSYSGYKTHFSPEMLLFQAADVTSLTGLTRSQLREWCSRDRRDLIPADVEPAGPGRHALYTWQTVLVLRLLRTIHVDFAGEVGAWAPALARLRPELAGVSFPSLWGSAIHLPTRRHAELVGPMPVREVAGGLLLPLDPHLHVLATRLSMSPPGQLPLFPAVAVPR